VRRTLFSSALNLLWTYLRFVIACSIGVVIQLFSATFPSSRSDCCGDITQQVRLETAKDSGYQTPVSCLWRPAVNQWTWLKSTWLVSIATLIPRFLFRAGNLDLTFCRYLMKTARLNSFHILLSMQLQWNILGDTCLYISLLISQHYEWCMVVWFGPISSLVPPGRNFTEIVGKAVARTSAWEKSTEGKDGLVGAKKKKGMRERNGKEKERMKVWGNSPPILLSPLSHALFSISFCLFFANFFLTNTLCVLGSING